MNKSCRVFVKLSRLVKFIFFQPIYLQLWICEFWYSVLVDRNIQWTSMVNYTPSWRTLMQNPTNTKVIYNGVLHNLAYFGIFGRKFLIWHEKTCCFQFSTQSLNLPYLTSLGIFVHKMTLPSGWACNVVNWDVKKMILPLLQFLVWGTFSLV